MLRRFTVQKFKGLKIKSLEVIIMKIGRFEEVEVWNLVLSRSAPAELHICYVDLKLGKHPKLVNIYHSAGAER